MFYSLLLTVVITVSNCREAYLNRVLESKNFNQFYLVLKVQSGHVEKEIIVLNYNLYKYLYKSNTKFSDITLYRDFIKEKINKDIPLNVSEEGLRKIESVNIKEDSVVSSAAMKGKEFFIKKFFNITSNENYAQLKHDVADERISQILKTLFGWNYLISIVEGRISIIDMKFCEEH